MTVQTVVNMVLTLLTVRALGAHEVR